MATIGFKANDQRLNDDFDNFDFSDFGYDVNEPKDDRHPVIKSLAPVGRGAKEFITNSNNIEKFVKAVLPKGYGQAYDRAGELKGELKELYNSAEQEIKPVKNTAKSLLRKALPSLDGKIPKSLQEKLESLSKAEEQWQGSQGDGREEQLGALLTSIFDEKAKDSVRQRTETNEREKIRQGFEQIRHRDQVSQLDAIRLAAEAQVQFQNRVTFNVHKKQLELSYRMFWAMVDTNKEQKKSNAAIITALNDTVKNTSLPDYLKLTSKERVQELLRNKFLDSAHEKLFGGTQAFFKKFAGNLGERALGQMRGVGDAVGAAGDMAGTMGDMDMPGMSMKDQLISQAVQLPMDWLAGKGAKKLNKMTGKMSKLRRGGTEAGYLAATGGERFKEYLTSDKRDWKKFEFVRKMLVDALPGSKLEGRMQTDSMAQMHQPMPFSRSASKSITEIIPGLLARIHREINMLRTGNESATLLTYDYTKNRFTTDKQLASDLKARFSSATIAVLDEKGKVKKDKDGKIVTRNQGATQFADQILSKIDRSGKLTPAQRERARKMLIEKSALGTSLDISNISKKSHWGDDDDGAAIAGSFNRYLRAKDDGTLARNRGSQSRQMEILDLQQQFGNGLGDPRALIQSMINAGQLETLQEMGIVNAKNELNREEYARWVSGDASATGAAAPSTASTSASQARSTRASKRRKPPVATPQASASRISTPATVIPNTKFSFQGLAAQPGGSPTINRHSDEMLGELRSITEVLRGKEQAKPENTVEKNVQSIADLLASLDQKYTHAADANYSMLTMMLQRLSELAAAQPATDPTATRGVADIASIFTGGGQRAYTSLWEHLKDSAGGNLRKAKLYSKMVKRRGMKLWDKYAPKVESHMEQAAGYAGEKARDLKGKLSSYYGDVVVNGESFPRLRAALLRAGEYRDKLTGRVITSLEDITGDVVDASGNPVITMQEFYNSYVTGSVNKRVKDLFSKAKTHLEDWKDRLQDAIPKTVKNLKDRAMGAANKIKEMMPPYDVFVKTNMKIPLLHANQMRYDMYFSKRTGKVIRHPRDIDGVVIDEIGNEVVTEKHIQDGLVDVAGDPVGKGLARILTKVVRKGAQAWELMRDAAVGMFGAVSKGLGNVGDYFKNFFAPFTDMITNSRKTVDLLQHIHDMLDNRLPGGKKVRGDLDGDGDRDGSVEDMRERGEAGVAGRQDVARTGAAQRANGGLGASLIAGITKLFDRKKKADKDEGEDDDDDDGSLLDDAADVADIADALDGDGADRESKRRRKAAKKRLKRMRAKGKPGMLSRAGSKLGQFGKFAANGMLNTGAAKSAASAGAGAGRVAMGAGSAALAGAGALGAKAAGWAGGASRGAKIARWGMFNTDIVKGIGKTAAFAGRGALMGGGAALGAARVAAPWLLKGMGFALSWPVSLALTAGWLGYEAYKYSQKTSLTNLSKIRLAQYGIAADDKDGVEKIFALEAMLEPYATLKDDGNLYLNEKKLDLKEVAELMEVTREQDMNVFNLWYKRRFVPVYRRWLTELRKINKDAKLAKIEATIPPKDKLRIAESVVTSLEEAYNHRVGWNQARIKLVYGSLQDVMQVLDSVRAALMKEREAAGGEKASVENRTSVAATTAEASVLAQKALTDKANYTVTDKDGKSIDTNGMEVGQLSEKIKKGEAMVSVAVAVPANLLHNDKNTLDALTSIRYKAYGLAHMSADKANMVSALEMFMGDHLTSDTDNTKLTIATERVQQIAGEVFGVPNATGEHANRWKVWFNGRFLPVFLLWAGAIRKKTGKTKVLEAHRAFPLEEQTALARAIIGARGINAEGAKVSVWHILSNPWADAYELNSNSDSTAGNLEAIRQLADKVRLGEISGKIKATNRQVDPTKEEHGKGWSNPNRQTLSRTHNRSGVGVNATGDTIVGADKNAKPLSGMGESLRFSGGGSGNYTELPTPTGAGWTANRELLLKAAAMAGVDPRALITTIALESSFNPNAAPSNPNLPSSAKGLGQHLDSSWLEDLRLHGKKFGLPNGVTQFDARASALMTASRLRHNGEQLQKNLGRSVTVADLYLAHLMGLGGATKFLKAPQDAIGADEAPSTAKQHPEYFYKGGKVGGQPLTVKEVYSLIAEKLTKRPAEFGVTDSDMKSTSSSQSSSDTQAAPNSSGQAAPGSAQPAQVADSRLPPFVQQRASSATVPTAGTPSLNQPVTMAKGKAAVMGTGPTMVLAKGVKYELILQREDSEEDGTYGTLRFPDGTVLNTLELPWRNNESRISCIPPGIYECKKRPSRAFGEAYEVSRVSGRTAVLIHAGNSAGSADKGMKADSQGCILLGMDRGRQGNQKVITASKAAMKLFHEKMADQPFTLLVRQGKNSVASTGDKSVNLDGMRQPVVSAGVVPKQESAPQAQTPVVSTQPNNPRVFTPTGNTVASSNDLPRLSSTTTGMSHSAPTKQDMQQRDAAVSAVIAPKIDGMAKTLLQSLEAQTTGVVVLREILSALKESPASQKPATPPPSTKAKPVTSTDVPVPQRRMI